MMDAKKAKGDVIRKSWDELVMSFAKNIGADKAKVIKTLKKCTKCGDTPDVAETSLGGLGGTKVYQVECGCLNHGLIYSDKQSAIRDWNKENKESTNETKNY